MNRFQITSSLGFINVNHLIPYVFISFTAAGVHFYFHFINLEFSLAIYFNVFKFSEPLFYLSTPSITISEFFPDATYLYHLDICWNELWYRKSFWRINEDNDKYPYTTEQFHEFRKRNPYSFEEFIKKMKDLQNKAEDIFKNDDQEKD